MDSVSECLTIFLTHAAGVTQELGSIGPEALAQWIVILRPLGVVEAVDAGGEVVTPAARGIADAA